jgi:FHA domain
VVSEGGVRPGLWPIRGDGVLARLGDLVLLIHPAGGAFADRLLDLLTGAARDGQDGVGFTNLVSAELDADAIAANPADPGPAAVAFGPVSAGTAVVLYGTAWADVTTVRGIQHLSAGEPYGRLRCVLPSQMITIRAGVDESGMNADTDPSLRLADGVVRAVALAYAPESTVAAHPPRAKRAARPEAAPPAPPSAAPEQSQVAPAVLETAPGEPSQVPSAPGPGGGHPETAPGRDFISVVLGPGGLAEHELPRRPPLPPGAQPPDEKNQGITETRAPEVFGVYCKNGHFDDPEARYCAVCGISMAQLTKIPQKGRRPPLGVLVVDDGSVFQLDADYVIGREPSLDSSVAGGSARPLRLTDAEVSRIHARVELDGWQVYISDLGSANGTYVQPPGEHKGTLLAPRIRTPLSVGTHVRVGRDHGFRYDSHRHR